MIHMFKDEREYWAAIRERYVWNYCFAFEDQKDAVREVLSRESRKLKEIEKQVTLFAIRFEDRTSMAFFLIEKDRAKEFQEKYLKEEK